MHKLRGDYGTRDEYESEAGLSGTAAEWVYAKNAPLTPEYVTVGSGQKALWWCSVCGNSWQAVMGSPRTRALPNPGPLIVLLPLHAGGTRGADTGPNRVSHCRSSRGTAASPNPTTA